MPASEGTTGKTASGASGALSSLLRALAAAPPVPVERGWSALRPGARVGRFELLREIGQGGFGVVWEARDTAGGVRAAFKALRPGRAEGPAGDLLLREAELAEKLDHPNLVALLDSGRTVEGPWLAMELLRGQTLAARLEAGPVRVGETLRVVGEVARGVAHAHAQGVVHRDLKPANVFLCEGGAVKVLDLGLAHAFGHRKVEGGTPSFMAPEQLRGAPEDERTDVFALGVILFRLLAGELPFPERAADAPPGAWPAVALEVQRAPSLGALVTRMLDEDPVRRPRDAAEVLTALAAAAPEAAAIAEAEGPEVARPLRAARTSRDRRGPGGLPPQDARAHEYCQRGRQFLRQVRRTSLRFAHDMFSRAAALDPSYALAHAGKAEAAGLLRMFYRAEAPELQVADEESALAVQLDPGLAEARASRGLALFLLGRDADASAEFERAVAIDPDLFEAWFYAGRAAFQNGRMEDAARCFRRADEANEGYQAAFFAGQALEALGRSAEARDAYAHALEVVERYMDLNPDDPRACTMRAVCHCRLGRREEGLRWAEQALLLEPRDAGVRYNVACLYALEGAREEALRCLDEVLRAGFSNREWIEKDPDLASLHGDPRFEALLAGI